MREEKNLDRELERLGDELEERKQRLDDKLDEARERLAERAAEARHLGEAEGRAGNWEDPGDNAIGDDPSGAVDVPDDCPPAGRPG